MEVLALGKVAAEPRATDLKGRHPLVAGLDNRAASPRAPTQASQSSRAKCSRPHQLMRSAIISWSCILAAGG